MQLRPIIYSVRPRPRSGKLTRPIFSIAMMCLSVCLSARMSQKQHVRTSPHFLRMLPMAIAQSSPSSVAVYYAFPVLWMTLYNRFYGGVTLPPLHRSIVAYGLTLLLHVIGCFRRRRAPCKTRQVLRTKGCRGRSLRSAVALFVHCRACLLSGADRCSQHV